MRNLTDDFDKCNAGCGRRTQQGTCLPCRRLDADKRYATAIGKPHQYKPTHPSWFTRSKNV